MSHPGSRTKTLTAAAAVALLALSASACSSSNSGSGTSTTSGGSGGGTNASQLKSLADSVKASKTATFKVTYTSSDSGGTTSTVTIAQKPPKSMFTSAGGSSSDTGEIINTGSTTYFCSNSGGQTTCLTETGGTNPLAGLTQLYSADTYLTIFDTWQSQLAARVAGVDISFSNQTFAGQSSKCVTWTYQGSSSKYCVTDSGVLAYVSGSGGGNSGSFQLTSYSSSVPDSDFALPQGATTVTLPTGVSVP